MTWFICGKPRKCALCDGWTKVCDRMWWDKERREAHCQRCRARIDYIRSRNQPKIES